MHQALFVEAKLEASKELGQYIEQLNVSLEEKRVVMQMARKGPMLVLFSLKYF